MEKDNKYYPKEDEVMKLYHHDGFSIFQAKRIVLKYNIKEGVKDIDDKDLRELFEAMLTLIGG
jgi:hypothetical protein